MFTLLRAFFTHAVKYVRRAVGASGERNGSIKSFRLPALAFLSLVLAGPALADFPASAVDSAQRPVQPPFCANADYGLQPNPGNPDITTTKYCVPLAAAGTAYAYDYEYGWSSSSAYYGWPGVSFPCGNASCKTGASDWGVGVIWVGCPANASIVAGDQCHCNSGYTDNSQTHNSCSALVVTEEALAPQSCTTCVGNPIFPLTGVKREPVHTGVVIGGVELVLLYDSSTGLRPPVEGNATALSEAPAFGALWKSNFHQKLQIAVGATRALLSLGNGQVLTFTGDGAGNYSAYGYNKDKLTTISGGWRLARTDGTIETFDSNGNLATLIRPEGEVLSFSYSGAQLQSVQSSEGRMLLFAYTGNLVTTIRSPDARATAVAYDANGNLTSLTWPDNRTKTFLYENAALPWALTGVVDENNSRYSTFTYDTSGHVLSTEHSGGVDRYSVNYGGSAPVWLIADTFDSASNTVYRKHSWQPPSGTALTRPNGESVSLDAQAVIGVPSVTSESQAAGSGSQPASTSTTYDGSGNVASRVDATGVRTCYTYDSNNREVARFEAATVTCDQATAANSRLITTNWHPDWKLPTAVTEPLKKTTIVYHGQPDPFNGNAMANCTSAPNRADGKPVPLVCKQVEQALLPVSGGAGASVDPYFDEVVLLLHADGTNGSTAITDSSPARNPITVNGGAQLTTSQFKYGTAAASFNGTSAWLRAPQSANFQIFGGDFTVEWWANFAGATANQNMVQLDAGATNRAVVGLSGGNLVLYTEIGGNYGFRISAPAPTANTWHHIALTRSGGTITLWLDGTAVGSTTTSLLPTGNLYCSIGSDANVGGSTYFKGYIDDLRITKGIARYTASFTPPALSFSDQGGSVRTVDTTVPARVSTYTYDAGGRVLTEIDAKGHSTSRAYFNDTVLSGNYDLNFDKVKLLLHGNGSNGSTSMVDSSPRSQTVSVFGNASISSAQSAFGGAAMAFDGTGDYLQVTNSSDFAITFGDFTLEAWIYITGDAPANSGGNRDMGLMTGNLASSGAGYNAWWWGIGGTASSSGTSIAFSSTDTGGNWAGAGANYTFAKNTWYHVATVRSSAGIRHYVNGVQLANSSDSIGTATRTTYGTTVPVTVGRTGYTGNLGEFNGYIDDLRVSKGIARYTSNFTPLAAQLPDTGPDMNSLGHTAGDLQSVANAAGQVTQYTLYDPAGRVRQMIDPKGIVTDITYTPRGWVSTVSVTPPGGSARTTSYSYDGVGQMTGVALPDGTSLAYSYDAAHRLTGVTDTLGNSVAYTLDAAGNRTGEDLRDATGALRRSVARSFDALNRLQQVSGAAQ